MLAGRTNNLPAGKLFFALEMLVAMRAGEFELRHKLVSFAVSTASRNSLSEREVTAFFGRSRSPCRHHVGHGNVRAASKTPLDKIVFVARLLPI
jgi:hypothetical protein